jgi:hypothetical protein
MHSSIIALLAAVGAQQVAAHATFQDLWVNGVDKIGFLFLYHSGRELTI